MAKKISGISNMSTEALQREIAKRQVGLKKLQKARAALAAKLAKLDAKLESLGGSAASSKGVRAGTGRKRPQNKTNLVEALAATMKGKTMTVSEAAAAVKNAGYKTNAANFRVMVNQAFIKHKNLFRKVSHGHYCGI